MIIICHIKSLSGIAFGCGVTPESDMPDFQASDEQSTEEEEGISNENSDKFQKIKQKYFITRKEN